MTPSARIVHEAIDVAALLSEVTRPANGAILMFIGIVRDVNDGRNVTGIEYSAYESMAESELRAIANEASVRFQSPHVAIAHRIGTLTLEDASVAIAVGHAHRDEAYALSRWVIEEIKQRVPIWKREHYVDGTREWVDPTAGAQTEINR